MCWDDKNFFLRLMLKDYYIGWKTEEKADNLSLFVLTLYLLHHYLCHVDFSRYVHLALYSLVFLFNIWFIYFKE